MRETTKLRVEITNRKRQSKRETWSRGLIDVNVMLKARGRQQEEDVVVVVVVVVMVV